MEKLYQKIIIAVFYCLILSLLIYSYVLVDPNFTLINSRQWAQLRELFVNFGYFQRSTSTIVYIFLVSMLFVFHFYFITYGQKSSLRSILVPLVILGVCSYPLLSHDFFNYMFDAKILTYYHLSPYLHRALDFPTDNWTRFMHWTQRTYPYGPLFLLISSIPLFFGFGKFFVSFLLLKGTFVFFYLSAVYVLARTKKIYALFFATNPLVIIEGLISSHNDLIHTSLVLVGIYTMYMVKHRLWGRIIILLSIGIKYLSLPFLFLSDKKSKWNWLVILAVACVLIYMSFWNEVQPWYFLMVFGFIPLYYSLVSRLQLLFAGLLFSYIPYVLMGDWNNAIKIDMKHSIILGFAAANAVYVLFKDFILPRIKLRIR